MFGMEMRTITLIGGPFDGRETTVGDHPEFHAYGNIYGNIMTTPPGGMPGATSMPAYRIVQGGETANLSRQNRRLESSEQSHLIPRS